MSQDYGILQQIILAIMSIRLSLFCTICLFGSFWAQAQDASRGFKELGVTFQQYPTGSIPGLSFGWGLNEQQSLQLRAGYNIVYHGDAGVQAEENGGGLGGSVAWLRSFQSGHEGWYLGGRLDVWFNAIDWENGDLPSDFRSGTTQLVVLQPTAVVGHRLRLGGQFSLIPELALGVEINAITDGEPTGEGPILLAGITLARHW